MPQAFPSRAKSTYLIRIEQPQADTCYPAGISQALVGKYPPLRRNKDFSKPSKSSYDLDVAPPALYL